MSDESDPALTTKVDRLRLDFLDSVLDSKAYSLECGREILGREHLTIANRRLADRIGSLTELQREAILELISNMIDLALFPVLEKLGGEDSRVVDGVTWHYAVMAERYADGDRVGMGPPKAPPVESHLITPYREQPLHELYHARDYDRRQNPPK